MQLSISFQLTSTLETCLGLNTCLIGIIQTVLRSARLQINVQRPHPKVLTRAAPRGAVGSADTAAFHSGCWGAGDVTFCRGEPGKMPTFCLSYKGCSLAGKRAPVTCTPVTSFLVCLSVTKYMRQGEEMRRRRLLNSWKPTTSSWTTDCHCTSHCTACITSDS